MKRINGDLQDIQEKSGSSFAESEPGYPLGILNFLIVPILSIPDHKK
jgi:hypothetical protein